MDRPATLEKMSQDVTDFIAQLPRKEYTDGWPEDRWKEEMEKHPFFMSKPLEEGQELSPQVEALQQLKYDPELNSPSELAKSYKEDGNHNFKCKKYRWAVDCYTKGLEMNSPDEQLNAELYLNRAAAYFHTGNFKQSLKDAIEALNLKPDYMKAAHRCAMCYLELNQLAECISYCDQGLEKFPEDLSSNGILTNLKKTAEERKKIADRNRRRELVLETKRKKEVEILKAEIKKRGIALHRGMLEPAPGESVFPDLDGATVKLRDGELVWPVSFLYLEFHTHDCIMEFEENACFEDHLNVMFPPDSPPEWDTDKSYVAERLQMYFSDGDDVVPFRKNRTLGEVLSNPRYKVHGGVPCFIVTVKDSNYDKAFRKRNNVIEDRSLQ